MDTMEEFCRNQNIPLTEDQIVAEKYLRSRGARFLIEYGYGNAVMKADALFTLECEKALEAGLIQ